MYEDVRGGPVDEHPVPGPHRTHIPDPRRAVVPAIGTAAACPKVRLTGLGTTLSASAGAYPANAPRQKPSTSPPCRSPRTFARAASTCPAAPTPAIQAFGLVSPTSPMSRAMRGSPHVMCQS